MAALGATDPLWVVQAKERSRYEEQFKSLNPVNGVVTGEQAKGFFLQSQLPPNILGQIWALSDTDSDGRMDINEFSVACKLINLKLRGYQIPSSLPPALKNLANQFAAAVTLESSSANIGVLPQGNIPPMTLVGPTAGLPTATGSPLVSVEAIPVKLPPGASGNVQIVQSVRQPVNTSQPAVNQTISESQVSNFSSPTVANQAIPTQVLPPPVAHVSTVVSQVPFVIPQQQPVVSRTLPGISQPPGPTLPQGLPVTSTEVIKTIERKQSVDSLTSSIGSPGPEWGVPHSSKLKYTQIFNTVDRARAGFLSGPQAKTILIQTKLPQAILAQIWALADSDSDGLINCEEFVLAMHLCDAAKEGRPVPSTLPVELVPPAQRRKRGSSLSISDDKQDHDKRKENFDKGQAELERRRAALLEIQRKEQEEREKKEREEEEKREALRAEQEAKRQLELQRQIQKQREIEQEQEEQRRRASEQREAARKELERQRQQEWEKAKTQELEGQRMKEQNNVLKLKAKNQALAIELATLTAKVKDLSQKISETRAGVSAVKTTIDGMRVTRDTHMHEMAALKNKLKEQNQRLLLLAQEKARLETRNKIDVSNSAATEQVLRAFTNKQITLKHLNEKLTDLQNEVKSKTEDVETNNALLTNLKIQLSNLVNECETIYGTYSVKRDAILQLKTATASNNNWRNFSNNWENSVPSWGNATETVPTWETNAAPPAGIGLKKYRALYKFESRNPDELSFQPGDIITVLPEQTADPGWLSGELRGTNGWFPEAYVELIDPSCDLSGLGETVNNVGKQPLEGILEVPESGIDKGNFGGEIYVSVYHYQSSEPGDLSFDQGESITVIKKDGDWWTGVIGNRTGLFPSNYVEKSETQGEPITSASVTSEEVTADDSVFVQSSADEIKRGQTPVPASNSASGRETPADFEHNKPVTPDFSTITSAQTKISKKGDVATVIAPYQATSKEQLSLARGQLVCIRKKTTTGWWEGELQAKGKKKQIGWFPASYVKVMASRRLSQTTPDLEAEQNIEKVIAMFPYKALNEDELTFEKDDVITVLSREEATWWRGELEGVVGLFPSNYVMPLDNQLRMDHPEEKLRQEAIHELVESEKSYTADIKLVKQVFERPLSRSGLITQEQLQKIFLNWREISKGNQALLRLLEERKKQSPGGKIVCIGDILRDNLPKMGAYVRFCSCQLSAGALLQQLTESSSAFREFCKQCSQRDARTQGLPLSTFLVKPMQRITKYPLLIAKVLEHTSSDHPDRTHLEEALNCAEKLCLEVNEGVREKENSNRLEWLQAHVALDGLEETLVFNSVTNRLGRRKFMHYGVLTKVRSGRELVGFLLSDCLILTQPLKPLVNGQFSMENEATANLKLYKKPLLVKEMLAEKSNESNRGLTINMSKYQFTFLCATSGETSQWIKQITLAQEKCKSIEGRNENFRFLRADRGSEGRLLVEIIEANNFEGPKYCLCEVRLNNNIQVTPPAGPIFKWNSPMQFLVQDIENDILTVGLFVKFDFKPDDLLDRGEIRINEILQQTRSGGPVLRKLALRKLGTAEILLKLDLVLFNQI
ncbi:hypothetical protein RUM43_008426 [Polyplax serrata]|uniref:Intersectin-1 n=1 Tax=Polyplax serrata TaxID=468196 RepID=A0AAN8P5N2_POLSC